MTSHKTFHSGNLAITVILRGPDGDRYGQVLLYVQPALSWVLKFYENVFVKNATNIHMFHINFKGLSACQSRL